jgi:hypothetical protein
MRKAVLDIDNRVIDLVEATAENAALPDAGVTVSIGCTYVPLDDTYLPPPDPPETPLAVPEVISRFQAKAALSQMALLDDAEAYVLSQGGLAAMTWEDINEFRRDSPLVNEIAPELGLDAEELDDLFRLAITIRV